MANGHGGARRGAGRKRAAARAILDAAAVAAEEQITSQMPQLIQNMLTLANGVTVSKDIGDGESIVFTQPPDRQANEYLINRVMGKPTERQEADVDMNVTGGVSIYLPERKAP